MASQVFYRRWRPQTLAEVVGQEQITQTLRNALSSDRLSHAYLFCGPRGTGKTSTGRILAKAVNCLTNGKGEPCNACALCQAITEGKALDVIEIDAASNRSIEDIRSLRERVNYAPNQARYKVYIIDEVHMLTTDASNALLKTLEEPPPHVIFILATTEAHKILPTIMSRCQRYDFHRLSQTSIIAKLSNICSCSDIRVEPEGLRLIAKSATGSLRDAENLLEQLATYYGSEVGLAQVQALLGVSGDSRAREIVKHIMNGDVTAGVATVNSLNSDGMDLKQFNRELVEYLRGLMLIKIGSDVAVDFTTEDIAELKEMASKVSLPRVLKAVKLFGQIELGADNYSTLPLELALVECALGDEEKRSYTRQSEGEVHRPAKAAVKAATPPPAPPRPAPTMATPEPEPVSLPVSPVAEVAEVATPIEAGTELERLKLNWKRVLELLPKDIKRTSAVAILRSAGVKPVALEDDTIFLAFRYPVHKEQIEKVENQQVVSKIIGDFLGRPCRVRCLHEPKDNHLLKAALKMGARITSVEEK